MVEKDSLKKIMLLKDLSDTILDELSRIAQMETFDEETILFRQDQAPILLYMLVSGKVFLNTRAGSGKSLTLDEVLPGRTFGVSALTGESTNTFTAVCAETSSIITLSGDLLREMFETNFTMGHALMLKVVEIFRSRMQLHTSQFLYSLANHPEIRQA